MKLKVLIEMRPAFEGFAGIPQEVRLLFKGLRTLDNCAVEGLVQSSLRKVSRGVREGSRLDKSISAAKRFARYSKIVISLSNGPLRTRNEKIKGWFEWRVNAASVLVRLLLGIKIKLTKFESKNFEDFTWRAMFAKSLHASDFDLVATADHQICSPPLHALHSAGLATLKWRSEPRYPVVDMHGFDLFIGQTPYPGRLTKNTRLVIRYHDAIPVFMPHTIPDKTRHLATHFYALMDNVKAGAWFACVSESTRLDLLKLFPEAAERAVTIHNMIADVYVPETRSITSAQSIIRARVYEESKLLPQFRVFSDRDVFYAEHLFADNFKYLLMVSTIEPRKNHLRLVAAWEALRKNDPSLRLVIVGTLGWDNDAITRAFKPWIDSGQLFLVNAVPAADLRVLYASAEVTVCPSLGEGFDFSGVESMASGGVTVASDIPVHREVYADAARYFNPYSTKSLVDVISEVLYSKHSETTVQTLKAKAQALVQRYRPAHLLPQWKSFIEDVCAKP